MKKIGIIIIIMILIFFGIIGALYYINVVNKNEEKTLTHNPVDTEIKKDESPKYIDSNPIVVGLYKYYGSARNRELISDYQEKWVYHQDISSFEVFYSNEKSLSGKRLKTLFDECLTNYENTQNYRIGYEIKFNTSDKEYRQTILSPKDTETIFDILEIYLYDDYHREPGVWYSHTTEEEMNENTLLTSIKLTAGKNIDLITTDIKVIVFTYDEDDFDTDGYYQGNSKYEITVKKDA